MLRHICIILFGLLFSIKGIGQLKADFTVDKQSGCDLLTVNFTNTTSGASTSTVYDWDFGDGNAHSTLINPSRTYLNQQTYTVTLTVTDNGQTSAKQLTITVNKSPIVNFNPNVLSGCSPFSVDFTNISTPGDGSITNCVWSFGDGQSGSTIGSGPINHVFTPAGSFNVTLTATNSFGCAASVVKQSLINVLLTPKASFLQSKSVLCKLGDSVQFMNSSKDTSDTKFKWSVSNGATSIENSPSITFTSAGTFTNYLVATNKNGCFDTAFGKLVYVNTYNTDFDNTNQYCIKNLLPVPNTSLPRPDSSIWFFSDTIGPINTIDALHIFNNVGIYTVKLINFFGNCIDSVEKNVKAVTQVPLDGFEVGVTPLCGTNSSLELTDTISGSKSWAWQVTGIGSSMISPTKTATVIVPKDDQYDISLTVTQNNGCKASLTKTVIVKHTQLSILAQSDNSVSDYGGCVGVNINFSIPNGGGITSYLWNFGDNTTSTAANPSHVFNSVGIFKVRVIYKTVDNCSDTLFMDSIYVTQKPVPDFNTNTPTVCGNNKTYFFDQSIGTVTNWLWDFGDSSKLNTDKNPSHSFLDTGYHDIKLTVSNFYCQDSITKKKYIYVTPPIASIDYPQYTCIGNRDTVKFKFHYVAVVSGNIDFGDGTPKINIDTTIKKIDHVYPASGSYLVIINAKNKCEVKDTNYVFVLKKQYPRIFADVNEICGNDSIKIHFDTATLKKNSIIADSNYYSVYKWEYPNNTIFNGNLNQPKKWYYEDIGTLKGLTPGQTSLRVILKSSAYQCLDTSNYLPLKIKGPLAGYFISNKSACFKLPIFFNDTSITNFNVPIVGWKWNFGDSTMDSLGTGGSIPHIYKSPGIYQPIKLKVIDQEGCFNETDNSELAKPTGPKADFNVQPKYIVSGGSGAFTNISNTFGVPNPKYDWHFTNSNTFYFTQNVVKAYPTPQVDTVRLIARNPSNGCTDSIVKYVVIKNVFAVFNYTKTYLNPNYPNCPPMLARFKGASVNADKFRWDFGDGSPGTGITPTEDVSYTYSLPGIYRVVLYAYKNGVLADSAIEILTVKGAFAKIGTSVKTGCLPVTATFTILQQNMDSCTWDFTDGNIYNTNKDTSISHTYKTAGIYLPQVILRDNSGCPSVFRSKDSIIVDSLHIDFATDKFPVCDSGQVTFLPTINSFSKDKLKVPLSYSWDFGTGDPKDTSNRAAPRFVFNLVKTFDVSLQVVSNYGCTALLRKSVDVKIVPKAFIAAETRVCEGKPYSPRGASSIFGANWKWYFSPTDSSSDQNPKARYFSTSKDSVSIDTVSLVTEYAGCYDTALTFVKVFPVPRVGLLPKTATICQDQSVTLKAQDALEYEWSPIPVPSNRNQVVVAPKNTTVYQVKATNAYQCYAYDTATITVVPHFDLVFKEDTFVCKGASVRLPVSGADRYNWTSELGTLKELGSNPLATPLKDTTIYVFTASDANGCFSVPGSIRVIAKDYPKATSSSPNPVVQTGTSVQLGMKYSPDVSTFNWTPSDYLTCTDCPSPISSPRDNITYQVKVSNQFGCTDSTKISISLNCSRSLFVPTAFAPGSPTSDGKNDHFFPIGYGIKKIISFKVFDRLGQEVFSNKDFLPSVKTLGWDGRHNNFDEPSGTYIYIVEAECDTGEKFTANGTVVLIR